MKELKNVKKLLLLLIMILSPMLGLSQIVQIDSINRTTLLDEKATVAQGNIVKQHTEFILIIKDQSTLIDSLRYQVKKQLEEKDFIKSSLINQKLAYTQLGEQLMNQQKVLINDRKINKVKNKKLRSKKIIVGPYLGFDAIRQDYSFGIGITYILLRF